jgi:tRNA A37 N6-isopentenylltransferase MiaA
LDTATQQIKFETHRFVRHQYNWFQLKDSRIKWFDIQSNTSREIAAVVAEFITTIDKSEKGNEVNRQ